MNLAARLPFPVLYALSDLVHLLLTAVGYRRKTIDDNLRRCFPEKDSRWRRRTRHAFYGRLADYFFETLKLGGMDGEELLRRMDFANPGVIDEAIAQGRSVAVYIGHCFNWEWGSAIRLSSRYVDDPRVRFNQIYRPLKNKRINRLFLRLRSRFGAVSIAKREVMRRLLADRREGLVTVTGFLADQRPSHHDKPCTVRFFGIPTPAICGTETLTAKLGMKPVFWEMRRLRRGYYSLTTIEMHPEDFPDSPYPLTEAYFRLLEESIRRDPPNWLWSHKRWKNFATKTD